MPAVEAIAAASEDPSCAKTSASGVASPMAATRLTSGPPVSFAGWESDSSPASSAIWAMVSVGMGLVYKRRDLVSEAEGLRYHRRMAVVHISEAEAARDFSGVMARVRAGERVVIEDDHSAVAVVDAVAQTQVRRLSESLRLAKERGHTTALDEGFGKELEEAIDGHRETLSTTWE